MINVLIIILIYIKIIIYIILLYCLTSADEGERAVGDGGGTNTTEALEDVEAEVVVVIGACSEGAADTTSGGETINNHLHTTESGAIHNSLRTHILEEGCGEIDRIGEGSTNHGAHSTRRGSTRGGVEEGANVEVSEGVERTVVTVVKRDLLGVGCNGGHFFIS